MLDWQTRYRPNDPIVSGCEEILENVLVSPGRNICSKEARFALKRASCTGPAGPPQRSRHRRRRDWPRPWASGVGDDGDSGPATAGVGGDGGVSGFAADTFRWTMVQQMILRHIPEGSVSSECGPGLCQAPHDWQLEQS